MSREAYFLGGPLDGKVFQAVSPRVRTAVALGGSWVFDNYDIVDYVCTGRWVFVNHELPYDGSWESPEAFTSGKGRLIIDVAIFEPVELSQRDHLRELTRLSAHFKGGYR